MLLRNLFKELGLHLSDIQGNAQVLLCLDIHTEFRVNLLEFVFLVQVRLRTEVPSTPSLTRPGFELMTSR